MSSIVGSGAGELAGRLARGEVSALEVTRAFLERVQAADDDIHAMLAVNPRAEDEAREADRRIATEGGPDALCGVPVVVKDNIATAGLTTTSGSRNLEGFVPVRDATAVARLRRAGAVILGKTNLDEFGMGSSNENSAFGPTRNPWDPSRVPGGSSGGSAAAVCSRMAPLALGSDTGGSVRQPAAFCGVTGLKPSYGRVSRFGLTAFASSLDQIGPIAANVRDCARLLAAVAGEDPADTTSASEPVADYVAACERGVDGLRIGLPREYFGEGLDPDVERAVTASAESLRTQGAIVEEVSLPHARYAIPTYYVVATAEASSNLSRFDGVRFGKRVDPGEGLGAMYGRTRGSLLGPEVRRRIMLGTYVLSAGYFEAFYGRALRARTLIRRDFVERFDAGIDLVLGPTTPTAAFRIGEKTDDPLEMYLSDIFTTPASLAGLPAISVPAGLTPAGLPVGTQLVGRDFDEVTLFRAAAAIEDACGPVVARSVPGPAA